MKIEASFQEFLQAWMFVSAVLLVCVCGEGGNTHRQWDHL